MRWKKLSYITTFHKELIALFLVGTAKYFYNDGEGGFWRQVEKIIPQINGNNHADIVDAFYGVIKKYGLPDFEEERNFSYKDLSLDESIKHLCRFTSNIWQVHPFCEGNGRRIK